MTDKKQLNEEELEKVTGGLYDIERYCQFLSVYSNEIGFSDLVNHINEKVLIDEHAYWQFGTIIETYVVSKGCSNDTRYVKVQIEEAMSELTHTVNTVRELTNNIDDIRYFIA